MNLVTAEHLTKSYTERLLFDDTDFSINAGDKIGLIGINGTGKSTLLKLVAGLEEPDSGRIVRGRNLDIRYLPQNPVFHPGETVLESVLRENEGHEHVWDIESQAKSMLNRLGIPDFNEKVEHLSGGQKKRAALASVLLSTAELLILDEPTNHLDSEMADWLEDYLKKFKGALLMITHDRYFLDSVTNRIVELDNGKATVYLGNYSAYSEKRAQMRAIQMKAYLNQQQEIKHQEEVIEKLKSFNREKSIKRAESREKMLNKIEVLEKPTEINDAMDIRLEPNILSGNDVLTVRDLEKSFGAQHLFSHVDFDVKRGERVAIIGDNGTGKTTILKMINGLVTPDHGEITLGSRVHIGYYDQDHQVLHMDKTLFEEISDAYPGMNNTQIRNTLASFLFTGDDAFKRIGDLSGGERGRVSLAKLMLSEANFLILDEPTNHLDITSKEILENALSHYGGTVLYVSHDRYFINKTATRILDLTGGKLLNYIGNYDYYLEKREAMMAAHFGTSSDGTAKTPAAGGSVFSGSVLRTAGAADSGQASVSVQSVSPNSPATDTKLDWKAQKEEQARLRKRQNDLKKVEAEIHDLETRDGEIDALLCDESVFTDVARLMELNKEKEDLAAKLEVLYEKWEELAE